MCIYIYKSSMLQTAAPSPKSPIHISQCKFRVKASLLWGQLTTCCWFTLEVNHPSFLDGGAFFPKKFCKHEFQQLVGLFPTYFEKYVSVAKLNQISPLNMKNR